jgi:Flp pilus assembly protein TadD
MDINPDNAQNYIARGLSYLKINRTKNACSDFSYAAQLDSSAAVYLTKFCK